MIVFAVKKRRNRLNRTTLSQPIVLFIIIHIVLLGVFGIWFIQHAPEIELGVFVLLCIRMIDKTERYVYRIDFDEDNKKCIIYFSQFLFFDFVKQIDYKDIAFFYTRIRYARGSTPITLRIKKNKKMIAEIREKYNLGWTNDDILNISKKLEEIKVDYESDKI